MPSNEFSVRVNGKEYFGWTEFTVHRSITQLCGTFTAMLTNYTSDMYKIFAPAQTVDIFCAGEQVMKGYIFTRTRTIDGNNKSFTISGRDITADLFDCSVVHRTGTWNNVTIKKLASDLCKPFGIFADVTLNEPVLFSNVALQPGETVASVLERLCKERGFIPVTNRFGDLNIFSLSELSINRSYAALELGKNILSIEDTTDITNLYSDYEVIGKGDVSDSNDEAEMLFLVKAKAKDASVTRYRPLIIETYSMYLQESVNKKVAFEKTVRQGQSRTFEITVQGYAQNIIGSQNISKLWVIPSIVRVKADELGLDEDLLIESVTYSKSRSSGSTTKFNLVHPNTYAVEPPDDPRLDVDEFFGDQPEPDDG